MIKNKRNYWGKKKDNGLNEPTVSHLLVKIHHTNKYNSVLRKTNTKHHRNYALIVCKKKKKNLWNCRIVYPAISWTSSYFFCDTSPVCRESGILDINCKKIIKSKHTNKHTNIVQAQIPSRILYIIRNDLFIIFTSASLTNSQYFVIQHWNKKIKKWTCG